MKARNTLAAMPRMTKLLALGLGLFAAFSLSACGAPEEEVEGSLTPEQAGELDDRLSAIEQDFDEKNCDEAADGAGEFVDYVNGLPADVGLETKDRLRAGGDQLTKNVADCTEPETNDTMPDAATEDPSTEEQSEPAPIPEEPAPVEEEPAPPEDPEQPADPAPTPPEDAGSSSGSSSGGSGGSSGGSSGSSGGSVGGSESGGVAP